MSYPGKTDAPIAAAPGVFHLPLRVPESLEAQRGELHKKILSAQQALYDFACRHNWQAHMQTQFAREVRVFTDKTRFNQALVGLCGLEADYPVPSTYSGALEQNVLICLSPTLYRRLYPQGDERDAWQKLLTHEMAHRLHIRLLHGDEDAMGPVWFYEGYALHAAGQMRHQAPKLTEEEIWAVVDSKERGDYRQYVTVFHFFLERLPLAQLVDNAGRADFSRWLRQTDDK